MTPAAPSPPPKDATAEPENEASGAPRPRPTERRRTWIGLALLLLIGVLVYSPALRVPFLLDDYLHASMIEGTYPAPRGPFDLYNFVNDADRTTLVERGMLPWWSHPQLTIRFFRPLSSALRWFEHGAVGRWPLVLHLHSLLWWAAAVLAARALFRRALAERPAWIATIIFALAPCHTLPLAWLANREALVSLTLGAVGLGAYVRWRETSSVKNAALAALGFLLAMLGGEYALCFGGYVLAFEIVRRDDAIARRALGLVPFALPAAAYLGARSALGFGTLGSGFYADPLHEPALFLRSAPRRLVTLLAEVWFSLDDETLSSSTPWWALAILAVLALALLVVPLRRVLATLDDERRGTVTWMMLGSLFSLAPVLAVVPSPRLLGASLLGVAAPVGLLLDHVWFPAKLVADEPPPAPGPHRRAVELTGLVALLLGFAHLVHGPATSWLIGRRFHRSSTAFKAHAADLRGRLGDPTRAEVVVVRGMAGAFFVPFALDPRGAPPQRWRILAQTGHALVLRRDARTFDIIVSQEQGVFPSGPGNLFRDESAKIPAGAVFDMPGVRVQVLEVGRRGPFRVRYTFDRDLASTELSLVSETRAGFPAAELPPPGFGKPFDP